MELLMINTILSGNHAPSLLLLSKLQEVQVLLFKSKYIRHNLLLFCSLVLWFRARKDRDLSEIEFPWKSETKMLPSVLSGKLPEAVCSHHYIRLGKTTLPRPLHFNVRRKKIEKGGDNKCPGFASLNSVIHIISSVRSSSVYHGLLHTQQRSTYFFKFFKFFRF